MATATAEPSTPPDGLVAAAPPSPAGPASEDETRLPTPPEVRLPRTLQVLRFNQRQIQFVLRARRQLGEVFRLNGMVRGRPVVTCHPDHVESLSKAQPEQAPSPTREPPLRPTVGPDSTL